MEHRHFLQAFKATQKSPNFRIRCSQVAGICFQAGLGIRFLSSPTAAENKQTNRTITSWVKKKKNPLPTLANIYFINFMLFLCCLVLLSARPEKAIKRTVHLM